jgi:uncharacterized membrane protein YphA (DoxX/SURF4 family)
LNRQFQISLLAVVVLVLLRIAIGWHFLHEGLWKYREPNFTAEPYLRQARGPLANTYRNLIPDFYGEERLNRSAIKDRWSQLERQAAEHYGFDARQRKESPRVLSQRLKEYDETLWENKTDADGRELKDKQGKPIPVLKEPILRFQERLAQWRADETKPETHNVPFERQRHHDALTKLQGDIKPWLDEIDRLEKGLRKDLTSLATDDQKAAGALPEPKTWLRFLEGLTTYSLIAFGLCLMLGFLSRLAALGGAVFLLTAVILPQLAWPASYPPPPPSAGHSFLVNKEVIEMLALLALVFTPAGRWAGLDYIGHRLFTRAYGKLEPFVTRYAGKLVTFILDFVKRYLRKGTPDAPVT